MYIQNICNALKFSDQAAKLLIKMLTRNNFFFSQFRVTNENAHIKDFKKDTLNLKRSLFIKTFMTRVHYTFLTIRAAKLNITQVNIRPSVNHY